MDIDAGRANPGAWSCRGLVAKRRMRIVVSVDQLRERGGALLHCTRPAAFRRLLLCAQRCNGADRISGVFHVLLAGDGRAGRNRPWRIPFIPSCTAALMAMSAASASSPAATSRLVKRAWSSLGRPGPHICSFPIPTKNGIKINGDSDSPWKGSDV